MDMDYGLCILIGINQPFFLYILDTSSFYEFFGLRLGPHLSPPIPLVGLCAELIPFFR